MAPLGPTGKFPQGKCAPGDEGELTLGIAADKEKGLVLIAFGTKLNWLGLPPNEARIMGLQLLKCADIVEGKEEVLH